MFLNYGHHPNAADDFSSLSVVLGSLGGDTCIVVEIVSPLSGGNLHHFCLNFEFDSYRVKMVEVIEYILPMMIVVGLVRTMSLGLT